MNDMPLGPAGPFEEETPRRDAVRAVGAAGVALLGTFGLGAIAAEARGKKRGKRGKKGKRGPAGPPADITSEQVSSESVLVNPTLNAVTDHNVECPEGTTVTGGGYELASLLSSDFATITVVSSQLHQNGWHVSVIRTSQPGASDGMELTVHAVCTSTG